MSGWARKSSRASAAERAESSSSPRPCSVKSCSTKRVPVWTPWSSSTIATFQRGSAGPTAARARRPRSGSGIRPRRPSAGSPGDSGREFHLLRQKREGARAKRLRRLRTAPPPGESTVCPAASFGAAASRRTISLRYFFLSKRTRSGGNITRSAKIASVMMSAERIPSWWFTANPEKERIPNPKTSVAPVRSIGSPTVT